MPNTGNPLVNTRGSQRGAPSSYTLLGLPDRMMPFRWRRSSSSQGVSCGSSSLYTWHSRTRRAMSLAVWPPKSRTTTVSAGAVLGAGRAVEEELLEFVKRHAGLFCGLLDADAALPVAARGSGHGRPA